MGPINSLEEEATQPIETPVRNRLSIDQGDFSTTAWANHYLPFFLMNRQTFLHHYLPAHLFSALVAGVVTNFVATGGCQPSHLDHWANDQAKAQDDRKRVAEGNYPHAETHISACASLRFIKLTSTAEACRASSSFIGCSTFYQLDCCMQASAAGDQEETDEVANSTFS
ncbi:hypothetical protein Pst134EA_032763 [Puccinia striiformis f. sp. tritici]|uniref:uncharacterized protein n=1 Tax=Puccinia striiformis f. sp. tritici TaxID=168172 RepID=UPI002007F590|nr:uncharacterized protein Pst134EA_032763 [Puccinia striiformis f. sp. tritici]KAH9443533.1 hypothetical protein Pst134EA_032763 [Puccinia striiformis f. sp. tritici]